MSVDRTFVRRTTTDDLPAIREIINADSSLHECLYGSDINLSSILETSFLTVSILTESNQLVGFVSLADAPHEFSTLPGDSWEHAVIYSNAYNFAASEKTKSLAVSNTLWVRCAAAVPTAMNGCVTGSQLLQKLLVTCFATCPQLHHVLFARKDHADGSLFTDTKFEAVPNTPEGAPPPAAAAKKQPGLVKREVAHSFQRGTILHICRNDVIPPLRLRAGIVEDYDDFIPRLLKGDGVVTPLPENLYLEELLENQDPYHAVIVAEDPVSGQVAGMMCVVAAYEDQQHAVKQYTLDVFNKLKPQLPQQHKGQQAGHNVCRISFFYLDPQYESRAFQFLDYLYAAFPFAEYCFIYLPHASAEHALLSQFEYIGIKKFQPTNVQGERLPLPEGLWLHCRYSLEHVSVFPTAQDVEEPVQKMLRGQPEISQDGVEAMSIALSHSIALSRNVKEDTEANKSGTETKLPFASYVLVWREVVVGVAVIRHVNTHELYALRENFDLDSFVNFVPNGNPNLVSTDHSLDANAARESFYTNDMPTVVVKHLYVKPVFRNKVRYLLREVLRHSGAQIVAYMAGLQTETYTPLIHELFLVPCRRMIDRPAFAATNAAALTPAPAGKSTTEDVDGLTCLWHATRKSLSDEKTRIHARIVVVGSSSTGLACIHSLLSIPYLLFTNVLLVSGDGLPDHPNHRDLLWTADTMDFLEREYIALKIGKRLKVMDGTMIDFDKFDKYICSDSSNCEPYDHLVITAGRQYTIPKDLLSQHGAKNGVFPLSNSHHITKVKQHIHESEIYEDDLSSAVIYGYNLDVFAVATSIVQLGLVPQRVVIVSPPLPQSQDASKDGPKHPSSTSPFYDPLIDLKVEKLLASIGTKVIKNHVLERLEYDDDNNLCNVVVAPVDGSKGKSVELNATMFIYCHEKDIDAQVLSALNKRSIVFDGRVIIENNYRTTDKKIYAAGPVAMFSRRFGPSSDFDEFSAREVGRHLSETLLGFLGVDEFYDPVLHKEDETGADINAGPKDDPLAAELGSAKKGVEDSRRRPKPIPKFEANVTKRVILPAEHMFFISHSMLYTSIWDKCTHLTSASRSGNNYVRVSIGPNKIIEAVSLFGNEPVELHNLRSLVGLPQSVLNLMYHYDETNANMSTVKLQQQGGVTADGAFDILAFTRNPWATAIFYDKFLPMYKSLQSKLQEHPDVIRVKADILSIALKKGGDPKEGGDVITDEERDKYHRRLLHEHSDTRHVIELELLKFLHANKAFIPQLYYLPDLTPYVPKNI